jgi:transposase
MVLIAVDPHKSSHTACAVDEQGIPLATLRVASAAQAELLAWGQRWPERSWAVEGARGLGQGLAQWLLAAGESVVDVPARLVRRVRELSGQHKTDHTDARAIAEAALRAQDLHAAYPDDKHTVLRLLSDRRDDLTQERTRTVNRLHRLLRELVAGGAPRQLSVRRAAALMVALQPRSSADQERLRQAGELLTEVESLERKLRDNLRRITAAVRASGTCLPALPGVGPVLAAKLLGHAGPISRFRSSAQFASYSGTAPREASSGEVVRHRLSRRGDRQLNMALHIAAVTQVRCTSTDGHRYYLRKRAEGKSAREALRCLKRQLAAVVYRCLVADAAGAH